MPITDKDRFEALHRDLRGLNDKVHRIELLLAEMSGKEYGARLEKLSTKTEALETFKSRVVGAGFIIGGIWPPLCGIAGGLIIWWITR